MKRSQTEQIKLSVDVRAEIEKASDSLKANGTDTILIFYKGCSGCIQGTTNSAYLFWKRNRETKVFRISNYRMYKEAVRTEDIFLYYFKNHDFINSEDLEAPKFIIEHYHYTSINLWTRQEGELFNGEVKDYYRIPENMDKKLMLWIYQVESALFNNSPEY